MSNAITSPPSGTDWGAIDALADQDIVQDDEGFDGNDPESVATHWDGARITHHGKTLGTVRGPGQRGAQKAPTKVATTLRLSPEVDAYFRATGKGWQTRIDAALKEWIADHPAN